MNRVKAASTRYAASRVWACGVIQQTSLLLRLPAVGDNAATEIALTTPPEPALWENKFRSKSLLRLPPPFALVWRTS